MTNEPLSRLRWLIENSEALWNEREAMLAIFDEQVATLDAARASRPEPGADLAEMEEAFIRAVNARSVMGDGLAVPHYADIEAIWRAIEPFAARGVTVSPDLAAAVRDYLANDGSAGVFDARAMIDARERIHRALAALPASPEDGKRCWNMACGVHPATGHKPLTAANRALPASPAPKEPTA